MALHLITGYAGKEHITSADQGAYNIATFGGGNFVLDRGQKFAQTVLTNNSIQISDGEAMIQGRFIKMAFGTSEDVTIENGTQGKYRNDLICIRYEKNSVDTTESASLVVIKGTESTTAASDPTYNTGTITDGDDSIADFPLYRVKLNGINIDTVQTLFTVKVSMKTYMDNYQMPTATSSQFGAVKTGTNISNSNGTISVPTASSSTAGVVKIGSGINISNGTISAQQYSLPTASSSTLGGVKIGNGVKITGGVLSLGIEFAYLQYQFDSSYTIPGNTTNTLTLSLKNTVYKNRRCISHSFMTNTIKSSSGSRGATVYYSVIGMIYAVDSSLYIQVQNTSSDAYTIPSGWYIELDAILTTVN